VNVSEGPQSMMKLSSATACSLFEQQVDVIIEADIAPDTQGTIVTVRGESHAVLVPCKQCWEHAGRRS
jgi:hypothetical protein